MKQNIIQYLMVGLLVVGSYMVGVYKTKAEYLEGGIPAQVAEVAGKQAPTPEEKTELTDEEWVKIQENSIHVDGEESAPVTIVEFTDYQCPFCSRYVSDTLSKIKTEYIETGKVRYMVRDLPLPFHSHSEDAAAAARCAEKQGKYIEMHDLLFAKQDVWSKEADVTETFVGYAKTFGMADGSFRVCLTSEEVLSAIKADKELAASVGASGTPTFYVNGMALVGAQPYAAFEALINEGL
ncbi:MAG: hypothetical protein DRO01_06895 [Thermoproteota archaeon]|nr:MAG: hypothetical protein DRO01_06895 [Candidatus Korarchaeota archaeon]